MWRSRSFLRGGFYHLALVIVCGTAFNWAFVQLTGVDLVRRLFEGVTIPNTVTAIAICVSAALVMWHNWVD